MFSNISVVLSDSFLGSGFNLTILAYSTLSLIKMIENIELVLFSLEGYTHPGHNSISIKPK